ncbi:MAG: methyltransferase domain-containing protein [Pseudomonadota bacterium]
MLDSEYETMYQLEDRHWWFVSKRNFVKTVLDQFLKGQGSNVLDVGSGTGGMLKLLSSYGRVFGIELHRQACELSRRRDNPFIIQGNAHQLPFKKESFDLITLFDVLYHQHVLDDETIIRQLHDLLVPGGLLMITDSAFEFLKSRHDLAVMARHRYTLGELRDKLTRCHFTVLKRTYLFCSIFPAVVIARWLGKILLAFSTPKIHSDLKLTPPALNRLLVKIHTWEGKRLRVWNFPFGSSLLILGRKD